MYQELRRLQKILKEAGLMGGRPAYQCLVRADYKFPVARVGGRAFSKARPVELAEDEMTPEIMNSPLLDVQKIEDEPAGEPEPIKPIFDYKSKDATVIRRRKQLLEMWDSILENGIEDFELARQFMVSVATIKRDRHQLGLYRR